MEREHMETNKKFKQYLNRKPKKPKQQNNPKKALSN